MKSQSPAPDLLSCRNKPGTSHITQYHCCKCWFSAEAFPEHAVKRHGLGVKAALELREKSRAAYRAYLDTHVPELLLIQRREDAAYALLYKCCDTWFSASSVLRHLMAHGLNHDEARAKIRLSRHAHRLEQDFRQRCHTCQEPLATHARCASCTILLHGADTSPCQWCREV